MISSFPSSGERLHSIAHPLLLIYIYISQLAALKQHADHDCFAVYEPRDGRRTSTSEAPRPPSRHTPPREPPRRPSRRHRRPNSTRARGPTQRPPGERRDLPRRLEAGADDARNFFLLRASFSRPDWVILNRSTAHHTARTRAHYQCSHPNSSSSLSAKRPLSSYAA